MEIHEDGDGLTEDDARPHNDIANLTSEQRDGRNYAQGHLNTWGHVHEIIYT